MDVKQIRADQRWAFDRDISLAAIAAAPPDAHVVAGRWWPADYQGPPLIMLDDDIAKAAGLKPGDAVTVSLLGRELKTRIAGLRHIDFGGFGANFPLVVDPAAIAGAGLRHVAIAKASAEQERRALDALGRDFPGVNIVSVRETLESAAKLFDQLALAVRGAAAVAGIAGALVLIGAIAATARARAREAAILKVLGASRGAVLAAYMIEYFAVGAIAGGAGALLGAAAAWPIVALVFKFRWIVDWASLAAVLGAVAGLTAVAGAVAALVALSARPAPVLRAE